MTTRVYIENGETGSHHIIEVSKIETHADQKHEGMTHSYISETQSLNPGEALEWYIWGDQKIEIKEGFSIA